jgi:proteic killer suppression protein
VGRFQRCTAQAERRLQILDSATHLQDLAALPSNRLEALKGDRQGQYSMRINAQWRLCFEWRANGAYNVEIVDYH